MNARAARTPRYVVVASLLALLVACTDQALVTTPQEPVDLSAANPTRGGAFPAIAEQAICQLVRRTSTDEYLTKEVRIPLPRSVAHTTAGRTTFAWRGWSEGTSDPVRLAICDIPDTPAALASIRATLSGDLPEMNITSAAVFGLELNGAAAVAAASEPRMLVEVRATADAGVEDGICDPRAIIDPDCNCEENPTVPACEGWDPALETDGPPPPDPFEPDASLSLALAGAPIHCLMQTHDVHRSTSAGSFGDISVHGRTECTAPMPGLTNRVSLRKQRCFWFICWWSERRANTGSATNKPFLDSNVKAPCETGYWHGRTTHTVTAPPGYAPQLSTHTSMSRFALGVSRC
jgi:hypothetical protein